MSRLYAVACWALVGLGSLQLVGFALGSAAIRGVGAMSAASPLPFVFSSFRGVETFAADFEVEVAQADAATRRIAITPAVYDQLDGPYNRRNAYGGVIAYGPAFTSDAERALVASVLSHGLCHGGPLLRMLPAGDVPTAVLIHARSGEARTTRLPVVCQP